MFCYKVLSVLVFTCLVISLATSLIGVLTSKWWIGNFEAVVPLTYNTSKLLNGYNLHILFNVRFGLTGVCWGVEQAECSNKSLNIPIFKPLKHCITELPKEPRLREKLQKDFAPFKNALICLIVTIVFNALAFIFATVKLPCIKISRKKIIVFTTLLLTLFAAIAALVALVISNGSLHYEADFMKTMMARPPQLGKDVGSMTVALMRKVFFNVRRTDLSKNFKKGFSFEVVCVAEFFLLVAFILTIFEHFCAKRSGDDEYKSELISDGYNLPEKDAPSAVEM